MALYKEIVYQVLDEVKALNGDSTFTEEHVIFLATHYRKFLLHQKKLKEGEDALSSENEQTICIHLEETDAVPGLEYCNDTYLRSKEEIPEIEEGAGINIQTSDQFNIMVSYVTKNRFKYVGHNKWLRNITYCCLADDNHLYFKSNNPQYLYMAENEDPIKVTGIFEDSDKAAQLACDPDGDGSNCDILDQKFPLESELIPQLIELIVKELYGAQWRPADTRNNANDDLADLIAYIRRNTKSELHKKLE